MYIQAYNTRYPSNELGKVLGTVGFTPTGKLGTEDRSFCITETDNCIRFWLATPCDTADAGGGYLVRVTNEGEFGDSVYSNIYAGVRPIVKLKENIKIRENSNGNYELYNIYTKETVN